MSSKEEFFSKLAQVVIDGEPEDAEELARQALDQGLDPLVCINEGLSPGIDEVGELFASGEYYLPDLIIGGDAMKAALEILEPALAGDQIIILNDNEKQPFITSHDKQTRIEKIRKWSAASQIVIWFGPIIICGGSDVQIVTA